MKARIRNRGSRNIGFATLVSMTAKTPRRAKPPTISAITLGLVQPMTLSPYGWMPYVMPTMTSISPAAKVMLPHQSIDDGWRMPRSSSLKYPHKVPNTPNGTETKKTSLQSIVARIPPTTRPKKRPAMLATLFVPRAKPLWWAGKVSVMIAPELAAMNAPPTPCTRRMPISHHAPARPVIQSTESSTEPIVNMRNPRLYILTLPNMSPMRPKLTTRTLVTIR